MYGATLEGVEIGYYAKVVLNRWGLMMGVARCAVDWSRMECGVECGVA